MGRLAFLIALLVAVAAPAVARPVATDERGIASMYSSHFLGRTTASGQVLDKHRFTAAHRKLPFGTRLVVTNKRNGRSVVVTINDRGPHRKGRIIDLSVAAARQLGMMRAGLVPVEIRVAAEQ
jgi:peptidoglycan lytic transglycosylase